MVELDGAQAKARLGCAAAGANLRAQLKRLSNITPLDTTALRGSGRLDPAHPEKRPFLALYTYVPLRGGAANAP